MAKKTGEVNVDSIVDNIDIELKEVEIPKKEIKEHVVSKVSSMTDELINCLKKEIVTVRHIDKQTGLIKDPKHVLYGGMAETAKRVFTVPLQKSGALVNVLTKNEKNYLEYALGLEPNAMSVYVKGNANFWSTANPDGISTVTLSKFDNTFDLSDPVDYIKVKILLANKDRIAPSIQALQDQPKATYEFVLVSEGESSKAATSRVNSKKQAYKILGKIEEDKDKLRFIVETIDGRPTASSIKLEDLQIKIDSIIQNNASLFVKVATDDLLETKVTIKKAIEAGIVSCKGDFLYLRSDGTPLCELGQDPTLNVAATFLSSPKHQDLLFTIQSKVK